MSAVSRIVTVAVFEFLRVFKAKDVVVTLVMFVLGALGMAWLEGVGDDEQAPVGVLGEGLELASAEHRPFRFHPVIPRTEERAREALAAGQYRAVVWVRSPDDVEILVRDRVPRWYPELVALLGEARRAEKVKGAGLSAEVLEDLFASVPVQLDLDASQDAVRRRKLEALALGCVLAMMIGLFIGSIHLFTSITGEKQNHVTESVLAAIPVQSWIDGKCVGIALVCVYGLASIAFSAFVASRVYGFFHEPVRVPIDVVDAAMFAGFSSLALLGFFMWFAFFAAVAATIDDPNTSSRGMFMFLPAAASAAGLVGIDSPDTGFFRFASMFPLTAPAAMPVRLVAGDPTPWELALAYLGVVGAAWFFRRAAAKIFGMAMLMRGKELAWGEAWRAFRAT